MTGSNSDALDLMQEVFLSIYRSLPSYRGDAQFKTWMMRIVANPSIDFLRKRSSPTLQLFENKNNTDTGLNEFDNLLPSAPDKDNPDSSYAEQVQNQLIRNYLKQLPSEQRLLIELIFFSRFTFEEICYQTGISVNTVKSRVYPPGGLDLNILVLIFMTQ